MNYKIAGVWLDEEEVQGLALTVAMPDCPITDCDTGVTEVPGDDLLGYLARSLNLDPDALSVAQRGDLNQFIADHQF